MKNFFVITLFLLAVTTISAQIAPKVYCYVPTNLIYKDGLTEGVSDYRWKLENNVWLKVYPNNSIELKISKNLPEEFYSLGPINPLDVDLLTPRANYFLTFKRRDKNIGVYHSSFYNLDFYISTDLHVVFYQYQGADFTIANELQDLLPQNRLPQRRPQQPRYPIRRR